MPQALQAAPLKGVLVALRTGCLSCLSGDGSRTIHLESDERPMLSVTKVARTVPASEFPTPADAYVCDKCGRDITKHLHPGRAHVRPPLGPARYTCRCGERYLSGAIEWDHLAPWDQRRWMADTRLAVIVSGALILFLLALAIAVRRHSVLLSCLLMAGMLFSIPLWPLFLAVLSVPFEIAASLWRTRVRGNNRTVD